MISDERILINKLWNISIELNPLIESGKKIDPEQYWKAEAYEYIMNYRKRIKKNEKS
jgi:hypothetical protein